jgi:hypothetical protein
MRGDEQRTIAGAAKGIGAAALAVVEDRLVGDIDDGR